MNQILSTSMPKDDGRNRNKKDWNKKAKEPKIKSDKPRNTKPVAIGSIIKFFAIVILLFGISIIGIGGYSIYNSQNDKKEENLQPTISIENKDERTILLKVTHTKNIAKVEYGWNQEEKLVVNGNNGKYLEKEIKIPSGTNTLRVLIVDENGTVVPYEKQYQVESNINFEVSGNKIKITYNGDKQISYMTYRWNEEEETRIDINGTTIEQEIEAIKGMNSLTVEVVDEDNNIDTKVQKINGVSKPKLEITVDEQKEHFIIITSDDEKLARIEFRLDEDDNKLYELNIEEMDLKELEYILPMAFEEGENLIEVTVFNSNGVSEQTEAMFIKH